ncbi:unnamed protein product, partial [Symbiodinium necroappetens]
MSTDVATASLWGCGFGYPVEVLVHGKTAQDVVNGTASQKTLDSASARRRPAGAVGQVASKKCSPPSEPGCTRASCEQVPKRFKALVLAFHMEESEAVKEILLAGDANRLVAELTFAAWMATAVAFQASELCFDTATSPEVLNSRKVRINDLAAPPDKIVLLYLEPVVALTIGFQSSDDYQDWPGWFWFEVGFALVLILECCLRNFVGGCRNYFCGVERVWNWCDIGFIGTALTDLLLELLRVDSGAMFFTTLLRFVRLVRLTRIVKVFRLHWMKELRLMLKGLVGSMQTLLMAFVLLFVVLYVLAGLATYTLGRDDILESKDYELHALFENLPVQPGYEGRILLCALIPVLLSALRQAQEGEHANTVLQAHESGHESKWTQCCVTKNTGSLKIQSRAFRQEAERILQDITYTGAYGPSDAFHTGRYVKHCRLALQLESCPGVHKTLFDLYEYADAGELITRIETFVAKYTFQSESYVWSAPDCPYRMESATDAGRCNSDLGHFMKLLDLWREGLRLVEQVNLYKGWRGYFKDKKTKALAKKQLDNVLAKLETLWSMFTAFRCFTGQCETIEGAPLAAVLGKELFGSA